ncbi:MAG: Ti-type conjugative transfer relaxase TraA [Sphingomicrobium sp.]
MAIYHFSAKVISRANGSSALAAAAYRSASRLHDQHLDRHHDFSNKAGVIHSEVMLPEGAAEQLSDRATLWNAVEAGEVRKDAQLAREIEFALPRELSAEDGIELAREFVASEFVERGMIADLNVHRDIGADGEPKPHAHVMVTMRAVDAAGFGPKVREWNRTELLEHWREAWAEHVNQRLAELDIDARVDHRSLEAQGINLEPQNKIGPAASRMADQGLASERLSEHLAIARQNGERIIAAPQLALEAITHNQATFTVRDLARFIHRHSADQEQFDRAVAAVRASPELILLGKDGRGEERFTSRDMLQTEQRLEGAADRLSMRMHHGLSVATEGLAAAATESPRLKLGREQQAALEHVLKGPDLVGVIGYAGTGKSTMLAVAREAWEQAGYRVQGLALSGIAAENLESGSGISSRTIASLEHQWSQGRDLLSANDVLVIDEAGMIGSRQMERIVAEAEKRGAKLVLVGDPEQLQAIEAGAAFRSIAERHGAMEIAEVRRQREEWQRAATRQLATGRTEEAIHAHEERGFVQVAQDRAVARAALIEQWDRDRRAKPRSSSLILSHTREEVQQLNSLARDRLREAGELGDQVTIQTARGERAFAPDDRIMFLRNERTLGVKNGSLGRVESVTAGRMAVQLDDGRTVAFDLKDYAEVDHGYAATIHKAQGVTVDRTFALATPGMDRHGAYVALSRHRDAVQLHYGADDFEDRDRLVRTLSRERQKDMASDYVRDFADRRAIVLPSRPAPTRQLGLFDQLAESQVGSPTPRPQPSLEQAVVRFARATAQIVRTREGGDQETPEQRAKFDRAAKQLNSIRPDAARDLRAAFVRDMGLLDETAAGNTRGAIGAMEWERRYRTEPAFRAEHFVNAWKQLGDRHEAFERRGDERAARRIAAQMIGLAKSLERDPQLESQLRSRSRDLGVPAYLDRPLSQALPQWIGWGRGRGLGR